MNPTPLHETAIGVGRPHHVPVEAAPRRQHILGELGRPALPEAGYWRRRRAGEGTFDVVGDLPADCLSRFRDAWFERIECRRYLALDRLYRDVRGTLAELRREHRLVLVTLRRDPDALAWQLAHTQLASFFASVISPAGRAPSRKSELLLDWYPIGQAWVIGDSEADIELASDLGADCLRPHRGRALPGLPARARRPSAGVIHRRAAGAVAHKCRP